MHAQIVGICTYQAKVGSKFLMSSYKVRKANTISLGESDKIAESAPERIQLYTMESLIFNRRYYIYKDFSLLQTKTHALQGA